MMRGADWSVSFFVALGCRKQKQAARMFLIKGKVVQVRVRCLK